MGTFLGVLLSYGFIQPLATSMDLMHEEEVRMLEVMKAGLVAFSKGFNPCWRWSSAEGRSSMIPAPPFRRWRGPQRDEKHEEEQESSSGSGHPDQKKKGHGGAHGGAWKVAYADFVTAMMALFIVLWIVGQSKAVKETIAEYFKDPVVFARRQGRRGAFLPDSAPPGTQSRISRRSSLMTKDKNKDMKQLEEEKKKIEEIIRKLPPPLTSSRDRLRSRLPMKGLRIELVDNSSGLFFDVGSARLKKETGQLLAMVAAEIGKLHNRVIVEGYTDARPYVTENYSNWELSVDRANVARKILAENGLRKGQVQEVRGFADQRLRRPEDPMDFSNRRVGILVAALPVKTPSLQDSFAKKPGR